MNTETGRVHHIANEEDEAALQKTYGGKLTKLSQDEYGMVVAYPEQDRPRELALRRFLESKADAPGLDKSRLMFAFRSGYDAASKDLRGGQ